MMPSGREKLLDDCAVAINHVLAGPLSQSLDKNTRRLLFESRDAARDALVRACTERKAALAAVKEYLGARYVPSPLSDVITAVSRALALARLNRRVTVLVCYRAYAAGEPMPAGTPAVVEPLCEALARLATEAGKERP